MAQRALADYDIDAERVFVTGLSAGGAMTAVMLATYPEVFAAGAVIAGLPYGAASNMLEAWGAMSRGHSRLDHEWGDKVRAAFAIPGLWPNVSIWHGETIRLLDQARVMISYANGPTSTASEALRYKRELKMAALAECGNLRMVSRW